MTEIDNNPYASPNTELSSSNDHTSAQTPQPLRIWLWWSARRGALAGMVASCLLVLCISIFLNLSSWWEMIFLWENLKNLLEVLAFALGYGCLTNGLSGFLLGLIGYCLQRFRYREQILLGLCKVIPTSIMLTPAWYSFWVGEPVFTGQGIIAALVILLIGIGVGVSIFLRISGSLFPSRSRSDHTLSPES